jgi:hypothetical protein
MRSIRRKTSWTISGISERLRTLGAKKRRRRGPCVEARPEKNGGVFLRDKARVAWGYGALYWRVMPGGDLYPLGSKKRSHARVRGTVLDALAVEGQREDARGVKGFDAGAVQDLLAATGPIGYYDRAGWAFADGGEERELGHGL